MKTLIALCIALLIFFLGWRLLSQRHRLPCPSWLGWMVEMDNPFAKENRSHHILSHLDLKPGMCIADVGCGPGRVTIPLAQKATECQILALDTQQGMLDKVQAKAKGLDNVTLRQASLGNGALEKGKYDYILLINVLGEIPNQQKALQEAALALKPGGILCITETVFDPHYQKRSSVVKQAQPLGLHESGYFGKWYSYTLLLKSQKLPRQASS